MTKQTHTSTPWRYEEATKTIRSSKENYWLSTMDSWDGAINNKANAKFIVKAVNNHDRLVEALKNIKELSVGIDTSLLTLKQRNTIALIYQNCLNAESES